MDGGSRGLDANSESAVLSSASADASAPEADQEASANDATAPDSQASQRDATPPPPPGPLPLETTGDMGGGADPSIVLWRGKYYEAGGDWNGHVFLQRSATLSTLLNSEHFTWTFDPSFKTESPGLAVVTDPTDGTEKLALYVTSALPFPGTIRVFLTTDTDPGSYEDKGTLANVGGYDAEPILHPNGKEYLAFAWGGIQLIELSDPWTTTGAPVLIATATQPWESVSGNLEAPAHVIEGGMLNLAYSADSWNDTNPADYYVDGLAWIPVSADPMVASNWAKRTDAPAFASVPGITSPGSGTFVNDGQRWWWVYDYWVSDPNNRQVRGQTVTFASSGNVDLGTPQ